MTTRHLPIFFVLRKHTEAKPAIGQSIDGKKAGDGRDQKGQKPTAHIVTFLIFTGLTGAMVASTISFIPLMLVDHFGARSEPASALLAIIYSSGFWAAPLGGHISDRVGQSKTMMVVGIAFGPVIIGLFLAPTLAVASVVMFIFGVLMFVRMPTAESYIAHAVPVRKRSTVLGIYFFSGQSA